MLEKTFYDLLNSILEMSNAEVISLLENYDNFLDSLLSNQELLNEIRTQMRLEGLSKTDMVGKKEELLADMRALAESAELEISNEKKELYNKMLEVTEKLYDKALESVSRETALIPVELCRPNAKAPSYAHEDDAGFDFYLPEDFTIKAHEFGKIAPTGVKMAIPTGYELQIRPRSGNSVKTTLRIANAPGTIDCGYRNEIGIICDNIGDTDLEFKAGDRIAQGILAVSPKGIFNIVEDINKIVGSNRGGGYGSTGK